MIITNLLGGLGNQLFQYAVGRALAHRHNVPLKLDVSNFKTYPLRNYKLSPFDIQETFCTEKESNILKSNSYLRRFLNKIQPAYRHTCYPEAHFHFDENFYRLTNNVYLNGYWQSEKYFDNIKNIIKQECKVKILPSPVNKEFLEQIQSVCSVSIHIRRGDYITDSVTNSYHGTCSLNYYYKSIQILGKKVNNPHFFVFSDDINWAKSHLNISNYAVTFVQHNDADTDYEDLRLMYSCQHNIIANSTFSWWGAWLNDNLNKIVFAPNKWFNISEIDTKDLIPNSWIKV